jgi:hypothetical protein
MRCWSNVHAARTPSDATIRRAAASFVQTGAPVHIGTCTKHSCRLHAGALDSIGAVEYDAEARSVSLPLTVALTLSGPIDANASSVVLLGRLRSAFRLPRSLIIGERGFIPGIGARSSSMHRLDRERSGAACRARRD